MRGYWLGEGIVFYYDDEAIVFERGMTGIGRRRRRRRRRLRRRRRRRGSCIIDGRKKEKLSGLTQKLSFS
jgi:hypothetical protein